nr:unnamed protein product [Rangifer tarandus platyrhynchus]
MALGAEWRKDQEGQLRGHRWGPRKPRRTSRGGFRRDLQASQSAGRGPVCGPWPAHSGGRGEVVNNPRQGSEARPGRSHQRGFSRRHHRRRPTGGRRASGSAHLTQRLFRHRNWQGPRSPSKLREGRDPREGRAREERAEWARGSRPASGGCPSARPWRRRSRLQPSFSPLRELHLHGPGDGELRWVRTLAGETGARESRPQGAGSPSLAPCRVNHWPAGPV